MNTHFFSKLLIITITFTSPCFALDQLEIQGMYFQFEAELAKSCYSSRSENYTETSFSNAVKRNSPERISLKDLTYKNQFPAYDKAVLISMIKDEEGVIFENLCWHYFMGFRKFIIIDNGSTDNSSTLITTFKELTSSSTSVIKIDDPDASQKQSSRTNACVKLAEILFPEILWVFANDADEFITLENPLEETLSKIPSSINCLYAPRITYIPSDDYFSYTKDAKFYQSIHIAHKRNPYNYADSSEANGKTFIRAHQKLLLSLSNHFVSPTSTTHPNYISALECGIHIREFPLRSPHHALRKIVNMGKAFKKFDAMFPNYSKRHYAHERYDRYLKIGDAAGMEEFRRFMTRGGYAFDERMPIELALKSILTSPEQQASYTSLLPPPAGTFFKERKCLKRPSR